MEELAVASELESPLPLAAGTGSLKSVILHLEVTDPEVVLELEEQPEDPERNRYALTALRLGVLSLRAAIRLKVWPASQILQAYGQGAHLVGQAPGPKRLEPRREIRAPSIFRTPKERMTNDPF